MNVQCFPHTAVDLSHENGFIARLARSPRDSIETRTAPTYAMSPSSTTLDRAPVVSEPGTFGADMRSITLKGPWLAQLKHPVDELCASPGGSGQSSRHTQRIRGTIAKRCRMTLSVG